MTKLKIIEFFYKLGDKTGIYRNKVKADYDEYAVEKISKDEYYGRIDFMNHKRNQWKNYLNNGRI